MKVPALFCVFCVCFGSSFVAAQQIPSAEVASFTADPAVSVPIRASDGTALDAFALVPARGAATRWLLHDTRYSEGEIWLLEGTRTTLLGVGTLTGAPGFGRVIRTQDEAGGGRGRVELWGVDPRRPRLVRLFRGGLGDRPHVVGQSHGDLVVAQAIGGDMVEWTIWRIRPGARARVLRVRGEFQLEGPDTVRGSRALAVPSTSTSLTGTLSYLDLDTGTLTPIGPMRGCWRSMYTALPREHIEFHAVFDDVEVHDPRCVVRVDPRRFVITSP